MRFYRIKDDPAVLLAAWVKGTDVGMSADAGPLPPLQPYTPYRISTPLRAPKAPAKSPPGRRSLTAPPGPAGSKGSIWHAMG